MEGKAAAPALTVELAPEEGTGPGWLREKIRTLYPGYFALVMATGIISNGFFLLGLKPLSVAFFAIAVTAFVILAAATISRAVMFPRELWSDLVNPKWVFSFFTLVAGVNVLGIQLYMRDAITPAIVLWLFSLLVWIPLSYLSFAVVTFRDTREGGGVMNGGWLIAIVGAESIAALGGKLSTVITTGSDVVFVVAHAFWGIGMILYGIFATLFANRLFFFRVTPEEMNPLFWVVMGAAAITVNAGSAMIIAQSEIGYLSELKPFVEGASLILWAWATWWIPLLVIFGIWRHVVKKVPLTYSPMYWSLVFPLGMYTVATWQLATADSFPFMKDIPSVTIWIAFTAWLITMTGLLHSLFRRRPPA